MNRKMITTISILALSLHILCFSYHEYNAYDHRIGDGSVNTYDNFHYSSHNSSSGLLGFIPVIGALVKKGYDALFGDSNALSKDEKRFIVECNGWCSDDFLCAIRGKYSYGQLNPPHRIPWESYQDIPYDTLFAQYQFYQFSTFKRILQQCDGYEDRILEVAYNASHGNISNVYACSDKDFKRIVTHWAKNIREIQRQHTRSAQQRHREQERKERERQERQRKQQEKISEILHDRTNQLHTLHTAYARERAITNVHQQTNNSIAQRHEALGNYLTGQDAWSTQQYTLETDTNRLLKEHDISPAEYKEFFGNQLQHTLHAEFLQIVHQTATVRYNPPLGEDTKHVATTLIRFADAGQKHNHAGYIDMAFGYADFCWGLLDCAKHLLTTGKECTLYALDFGIDATWAVAKGIHQGGKNFGNKVQALCNLAGDAVYYVWNPGEGLQELATKINNLKKIMRCVAQEDMERHRRFIERYGTEGFDRELTLEQEHFIQGQVYGMLLNDAHTILMNMYEFMDRDGVLQCVEKSSALATEMALSGATGKAIGAVAQAGAHSIAELMHDFSCFGQAPLNVGTMQASLALEASGALSVATAIEGVSEALAKGGDVAGKVGQLGVLFSEVVSDKPKSATNSISGGGGSGTLDQKKPKVSSNNLTELQKKFRVKIKGIEEIHKSLVNLDSNSRSHILNAKHNWHRFVKDPSNFDSVARIMTKVCKEGTIIQETKDVFLASLEICGETVEVRFVKTAQGIFLSNGWVK